jgi:hypothetical protein
MKAHEVLDPDQDKVGSHYELLFLRAGTTNFRNYRSWAILIRNHPPPSSTGEPVST